jgi:glycopeptide antibiotics resistance protein
MEGRRLWLWGRKGIFGAIDAFFYLNLFFEFIIFLSELVSKIIETPKFEMSHSIVIPHNTFRFVSSEASDGGGRRPSNQLRYMVIN